MRAFIEAAPRSWKDILEEYIGQNSGRLLAYGNLRAELGRLMEAPHFPTPSRPTVISSVTPRRRPTIVGTTSTDPPDRQERTNTMVGPYEKRTRDLPAPVAVSRTTGHRDCCGAAVPSLGCLHNGGRADRQEDDQDRRERSLLGLIR
jgi:hypothetical protein